jgi:HlyD family secretion protein
VFYHGVKSMRVRITLLLLLLIAFGIPFLVLRVQSETTRQEVQQQTDNLEVFIVQPGTVRDFVETSGNLEADAVASLSFPLSGQVAEIYVREGDYVLAGSILARLDNDFERIAYEQAAMRVNDAEVNYFSLQTVDPDRIAIAEANLHAAWSSYGYVRNQLTDADLAAMESQFRRLRDEADYLELEASQAPGGVGSSAWESLTAEAGETSFNAEIARLQIVQAQNQNEASGWSAFSSVIARQAELDQLLAGATEAELARAELSVTNAQTQLTFAQQDYEDTFLIAPFDGVISAVDIELGATVIANSAVAEMTDITPLTLSVQIDEIDLSELEIGAPVDVTFDALPGVAVTGTLENISARSTVVNNVVTYEAEIALDFVPESARVGMTTNVQIITEAIDNVFSIPNRFITENREAGRITVTILTDAGELVEREVELGLRGVQNSEVVSGLNGGERLALINVAVTVDPDDPFAP